MIKLQPSSLSFYLKKPRRKCFSVVFGNFLRTLRVAVSYSPGCYAKKYPDIILKRSK